MADMNIMQGLIESLSQRPQDATAQQGALLSNLMAQPNPVAAMAASLLPQQMANIEGAARGLFGIPAPVSPQQRLQEAITANFSLLGSPTGLADLAKLAQESGDRASALLFSAEAYKLQQQQAEKTQQVATTQLQRATATNYLDTLAAAVKNPNARAALLGLKNPVSSGALPLNELYNTSIKTIMEGFKEQMPEGMKLSEVADLYKSFTPESVAAFMQNPSAPLAPLPQNQEAAPPASVKEYEYAQKQGYPGSFTDFLNMKASSVVAQTASPAEQVTLLNTQLSKLPTVAQTENNIAQLNQVKAILPVAGEGKNNPQAYTLVTSVLPQIVGSKSRAQAEIDAFRDRKGIRESIGDWALKAFGGTASKETLDNLNEIVQILERTFAAQRLAEVSSVARGYQGAVDEQLLSNWQKNQLTTLNSDIEDIVNQALGF